MSINIEFKNTDKNNVKFWRAVGVSIDSLNEQTNEEAEIRFKAFLHNSTLDELKELSKYFGVNLEGDKKEDKLECFRTVSIEEKRILLILREFLNRKKKTVVKYYNSITPNGSEVFQNSQVCQLAQLLDETPEHIIQIYTWHFWDSKGTGIQYSLNTNAKFNKAYKLVNEYADHFVNHLYKSSNKENNYRIFSYGTQENNKIIVMIYRQINDATKPDFDEPLRNKEVALIMFQIDVTAGILEIRSKFQKEKYGIIKYVEQTFDTSIVEIKPELFTKYHKEEVKNAILEGISPGDVKVSDFVVNKISFRGSTLVNAPSLTFELDNADILPSVKDAHVKECIDIESLKDIESLSFKTSKVSRTVRSTVLENGNIIFSIDDSGIDSSVKTDIENKFLLKFGIPLNKLISNSKFMVGKADLTDFLMSLSSKKELTINDDDVYKKLVEDKLITEDIGINVKCKNPNCDFTVDISGDEMKEYTSCHSCGNQELKMEPYENLYTSEDEVRKYVKKIVDEFCSVTQWELLADSEREYFNIKIKIVNLVNKLTNESLQIIVQKGAIHNKILEKINRSLTPTIIIFIGVQEKYLEKYNNNCIFPINFGRIYNLENSKSQFMSKMYHSIEERAKAYLASVANKSCDILRNLPEPENIGKEYTPSDFEDDVFNILKDIFPNADKWGKRMTGKEVPEGLFTLGYNTQVGAKDNKWKYVFSYDCKLNKNKKGYDLSKGEQRKAFDYVETLNEIKYITTFSNINQLSAHIFISNNFNENNYETMAQHFYRKLPEGADARPIFLPIDVLIYLHSEYRKHHQQISNSRNTFMEGMYDILTTDSYVIKKEDIEELFERALDKELADYQEIDTNKVRKDVLRQLKKR